MKRFLIISVGLVVAPRVASAQVAEPSSAADVEQTEPAASDPPPTETRPAQTVTRVALVAGYRGLDDLSVLGGGAALSIGGEGRLSGHFNLRLFGGRTLGGLGIFEGTTSGTVEFVTRQGIRFGLGGGLALFSVTRATTGRLIMSCGPEGLLRLGYDFAPRHAAYILADVDIEWQASAAVWGPTLAIGYRF